MPVRIYLYGMDYLQLPPTDLTRGLTREEAAERLAKYGYNRLTGKKKRHLILRFFDQFKNFMVIILLIAAAVSFGISLFEGGDFVDPIIILAVVILNAILGVAQESRATKAIDALKKMTSPAATVIRDGERIVIKGEEIVIGDLIVLQTGDYIPCDAQLVECYSLQAEESAVTGESVPVPKDLKTANIVLGTTLVTYGRGTAVAIRTGMNIEVGKIAGLINNHAEKPTPLQVKLAAIGKFLGIAALVVSGAIFGLGIMRRLPAFEMFMTAISLAVAAIPEGLPTIVIIMLSLGVLKMSRHKAIIRKIPAVETLGRATVICSDKTGTLTQNKMTVTDTYGDNDLLQLAALCCDYQLSRESRDCVQAHDRGDGDINTKCYTTNDPTENAILTASGDKAILDTKFPRIFEIPFDSARKLMTVVVKYDGRTRVITKGAPDILLSKCTDLSNKNRADINKQLTQMADKALRVIAVAYRDISDSTPKNNSLENNLTFAGLIGMIDPPRPEVADAIKLCRKAGIRPVMITGDHVGTATAIAAQIGILRQSERAITGAELDKMSEAELARKIYDYPVFARVSPANKMQIVRAFQSRGAIVAMTGDGVNDAPALKSADIGCAMGITGTDVAKGAADMVLTDDNFATIVTAVAIGRGIYGNIRKSIHFLLSSNIGEIVTIFVGIVLGYPAPLLAIHLLWINLVTDSLPAIALGLEPADRDIMSRKPINPRTSIFAGGLGAVIVAQGVMIGLLGVAAYIWGLQHYNLIVARTMAFGTLAFAQLNHALNTRSNKSMFEIGPLKNLYLIVSLVICYILQFSIMNITLFSGIFRTTPLSATQWLFVISLSIVPLIVVELVKLGKSLFFRKSSYQFSRHCKR